MSHHWLADFCDSLRIFTVVVVTQMMVFIYALSFLAFDYAFFNKLAIISLLAQLIAISLVILLCKLNNFFNRFATFTGLLILILMVSILTTIYTQFIVMLDQNLGFGLFGDTTYVNLKLTLATEMTLMGLIRYFYIQEQWLLQVQAQSRSELNALQARIKPHFLYNSMNSIASLISIDSQAAEKAVLNLSGLFRKAFANQSKRTSLAHEIEWIDQYLAIEQLRLQDRLIYKSNIDQELLLHEIPVLCIQPLIENAVLHGIQHLADGGIINLNITQKKNRMHVVISNPFDTEKITHGQGTGIENIRQRLQLSYDDKAYLTTSINENIFTAKLDIPL